MITGLYARLIAIGLIMAALAGAWFYVSHLRAENAELTQQVAILGAKLDEQNKAVEAWKAEADKRQKAGEEALKLAQAETVKAKAKAGSFYKAKPSTPGDNCKSALDLMNGVAK